MLFKAHRGSSLDRIWSFFGGRSNGSAHPWMGCESRECFGIRDTFLWEASLPGDLSSNKSACTTVCDVLCSDLVCSTTTVNMNSTVVHRNRPEMR